MKTPVIAAALVCLPMAVWAWQSTLAVIDVTEATLQSQIERATRRKGNGLMIALLGSRQLAAAKALSEPQQVALMKELAATARTITMSPAFQAAHEAYIGKQYAAVNHGITVKTREQTLMAAAAQGGASESEWKMKRQMAAIYVQMATETNIDDMKMMFDSSVREWNKAANTPNGPDRAKYAKLVGDAHAIKDLSVSDPDKFRRGYAVLRSAEADGLDTEEALFGTAGAGTKDAEQAMWDRHNLRGGLKRVLTQLVAEAPTVDFAAQTIQKGSSRVFVNPAYETKSITWKAIYRAGKATSSAGVEIARAWLKEL